ncbi:MAG: hypothetical protein J3Q66DRAFT_341430 [Benniella sp.]|nr:MAG: hypothetical protein J3Q66DRAFT_341430 [Benniella sp.]
MSAYPTRKTLVVVPKGLFHRLLFIALVAQGKARERAIQVLDALKSRWPMTLAQTDPSDAKEGYPCLFSQPL